VGNNQSRKFSLTISNPRDFFGGLILVGIALFALWASSNLGGMRGFAFGAGTAPRLFAGLLAVFGAIVAIMGMATKGPAVEPFAFRGPIVITLAVLIFAFTARSFGLVASSFVSIVVAAQASPDSRLVSTLIWATVLTVFCAVLFPYGLNLPMALWPEWLQPWVNQLVYGRH
jgi:putative tricarboxylic transport membrane protein